MDTHYQLIVRAITYSQRRRGSAPSLVDLARELNLSTHQCLNLLEQWGGIDAQQFFQCLNHHHMSEQSRRHSAALKKTLDPTLSNSQRLHNLTLHWTLTPPKRLKTRERSLTIEFGCHTTMLGEVLIATTRLGICFIAFTEGNPHAAQDQLFHLWPTAHFINNQDSTAAIAQQLFTPHAKLTLHVTGTPFQHRIWNTLLGIPVGALCSYQSIAAAAGNPLATRATASAIARNPIAILIPCHRVIRSNGDIGGYHWGSVRKTALILHEQKYA